MDIEKTQQIIAWLEEARELLERAEEAISDDLLPNVGHNWGNNYQLYCDISKFNESVWRNNEPN